MCVCFSYAYMCVFYTHMSGFSTHICLCFLYMCVLFLHVYTHIYIYMSVYVTHHSRYPPNNKILKIGPLRPRLLRRSRRPPPRHPSLHNPNPPRARLLPPPLDRPPSLPPPRLLPRRRHRCTLRKHLPPHGLLASSPRPSRPHRRLLLRFPQPLRLLKRLRPRPHPSRADGATAPKAHCCEEGRDRHGRRRGRELKSRSRRRRNALGERCSRVRAVDGAAP